MEVQGTYVRTPRGESAAEPEPYTIRLVPLPQQASSVVPPPTLGAAAQVSSLFVVEYAAVLSVLVSIYLVYLLLPRGARKAYCRAYRRRYARASSAERQLNYKLVLPPDRSSVGASSSSALNITRSSELYSDVGGDLNITRSSELYSDVGGDLNITKSSEMYSGLSTDGDSLSSVEDSILHGVEQKRRQEEKDEARQQQLEASHQQEARQVQLALDRTGLRSNITGSRNKFSWTDNNKSTETISTIAGESSLPPMDAAFRRTPSPRHPSIPQLPDQTILDETMRRLTGRGVRLMAHGVQCQAKRVWIRLDILSDPTARNLEWQSEVPRNITNQTGSTSIVLMRGPKHVIAMPNILYVDVGKKTVAFTKPSNKHIPGTVCFSLLTQTGSLDLQTNSRLERDAVVSCLCLVLDQVHPYQDWRLLYSESPPSQSGVSTSTWDVSRISSNAFPTAADV